MGAPAVGGSNQIKKQGQTSNSQHAANPHVASKNKPAKDLNVSTHKE